MAYVVEQPGNRPCSACAKPMSENGLYWIRPGRPIQCICTLCKTAGFVFADDGMVTVSPKFNRSMLKRIRAVVQ